MPPTNDRRPLHTKEGSMPIFSASQYLSASDLPEGEDLILTITAFTKEDLKWGSRPGKKWVLQFKEHDKGLPLNKVNGETVCQLYGEEMHTWVGKRLALYVAADVKFNDELVRAIR